MRTMLLTILMLSFALPVSAQEQPSFLDTIHHSYGEGRISFVDRTGRVCQFTAQVETKSPMMWQGAGDWRGPYDSAFSYTLRNLTPVTVEDATCNYYRRLDYNFPAICRAFSYSDGSIGVDVPGVGIIQVLPRNADVRAIFAKNAQNGNGNWGFNVMRIWYRLSVLEDGALEILAYLPRGWNSKP